MNYFIYLPIPLALHMENILINFFHPNVRILCTDHSYQPNSKLHMKKSVHNLILYTNKILYVKFISNFQYVTNN